MFDYPINPKYSAVSKVLQISVENRNPQCLSAESINLLLQQYGEVAKIKITGRTSNTIQALVEMDTPENYQKVLSQRIPLTQIQSTNLIGIHVGSHDEGVDYSKEDDQYLKDLTVFFEPVKSSPQLSTLQSPETHSTHSTMTQFNSDESFQLLQRDMDKIMINQPVVVHPFAGLLTTSETPTNVQHLRGDFSLCTARHLYNLYSNFGNISKIYLIRILQSALIEYETIDHCRQAHQIGNNIHLFTHKIQSSYCTNGSMTSVDQIKNTFNEDDIFLGSQASNRFRPFRNLTVQAPSSTIHVSNLKYQTSNADTMWDLFSNFGIVEAVKVLNTQQKFMCIVKMESMNEAITVVACMHNYLLEGRNMQISFTSQII